MSQFGMQMPGGRQSSGPTPDVYTGMMFLAVVSMIVACAMLWVAGSKISPDGMPLSLQSETPNGIKLP